MKEDCQSCTFLGLTATWNSKSTLGWALIIIQFDATNNNSITCNIFIKI